MKVHTPLYVAKFGGTSLSTAQNISKCAEIVKSNPARRFVVVSAAGKRFRGDTKMTDILIDRLGNVCDELNVPLRDYCVSRGEQIMAVIFAHLVGYTYIDAADYIVIRPDGEVDLNKTRKNFMRLDMKNNNYVMGGFYGSDKDGNVKTFARGGSDYTGAIAAVCLDADLYENFTDTYGVMTADPNIDQTAVTILEMTYDALHDMALNGAQVVFANCVPLLKIHSVPLRVDNTFDAGKKFTVVH